MVKKSITAFLLLGFCSAAAADYVVTGNFTADNCTGVFKKVCTIEIVAAFKKQGQLYKMPEKFATVSSYGNNHCTIQISDQISSPNSTQISGSISKKTSAALWTPLDTLVSFTEFPDFYKKNQSKQFIKLSSSYLAFSCTKTLD